MNRLLGYTQPVLVGILAKRLICLELDTATLCANVCGKVAVGFNRTIVLPTKVKKVPAQSRLRPVRRADVGRTTFGANAVFHTHSYYPFLVLGVPLRYCFQP